MLNGCTDGNNPFLVQRQLSHGTRLDRHLYACEPSHLEDVESDIEQVGLACGQGTRADFHLHYTEDVSDPGRVVRSHARLKVSVSRGDGRATARI